MKALVTGGAGFIGMPVCRKLSDRGAEVTSYDWALEPADDIGELDRVQTAMEGVDVVVHLAAKVGLGVELADIDDYVRQNDLGTAVVLRAAAAARIERVVYASSMVVYGEGAYACVEHGSMTPPARRQVDLEAGIFDPRCPVCEQELIPGLVPESAPMDPRNVYAATKAQGEHLLAIWCRETGGRAVALRFHNVYGPGMPRNTPYAGVASLFRSSLERGEAPRVFEDGRQRRNFVHVEDVARAVVAASWVDLPEGLSVANIGSPTITTIGQMAAGLADALDGPPPVVTGQYRLGDVRHITADCTAAETLLGWQAQISLDDGIQSILSTI